jgi:hypothetical protein
MTYAARIAPALEELRSVLEGAGVKAATRRDKVPVPGAFVAPASVSVTPTLGGGLATLRAHVLLVAADNDAATTELAKLLDAALGVLEPDEDVDTSLLFPINNNPLPAWRLVVDLELEES